MRCDCWGCAASTSSSSCFLLFFYPPLLLALLLLLAVWSRDSIPDAWHAKIQWETFSFLGLLHLFFFFFVFVVVAEEIRKENKQWNRITNNEFRTWSYLSSHPGMGRTWSVPSHTYVYIYTIRIRIRNVVLVQLAHYGATILQSIVVSCGETDFKKSSRRTGGRSCHSYAGCVRDSRVSWVYPTKIRENLNG